MTDTVLKPLQRTRYAGLKVKIRQFLDLAFSVGALLAEVRDDQLYLEEYTSFKEFCKQEYGLAEQRAYQLIGADEVRRGLPEVTQQLLSNEGQARALAKVPKEKRATVLKDAAKSGKVTAAGIDESAKSESKEIEQDFYGRTIPEKLVEDWQRADRIGSEIRSLLNQVKKIVKEGLGEGEGKKDIIFAEVLNPTISDIESLRYKLGQVIPHVLCPSCQGRLRKDCQRCYGKGFLSKYLFESAGSKKEKELLEKLRK